MLTNDRLAQLRKYLPTQPAPSIFWAFNIALRVRDRIAGGIPKNPDVIRAWLEAKLKPDDVENVQAEITQLIDQVEEKTWSGFKRDAGGLFLEERNIKAMLREAAFQLELTRERGFREDIAHGTFVKPERIRLLRAGKAAADEYGAWTVSNDEVFAPVAEPDGVETAVVHATTPAGKMTALKKWDFVVQPVLVFQIWANAKGALVRSQKGQDLGASRIKEMLAFAQELGLGANRSQGWGKFDVLLCEEAETL